MAPRSSLVFWVLLLGLFSTTPHLYQDTQEGVTSTISYLEDLFRSTKVNRKAELLMLGSRPSLYLAGWASGRPKRQKEAWLRIKEEWY